MFISVKRNADPYNLQLQALKFSVIEMRLFHRMFASTEH
jgi:hypothetical protein